MKLSKGLSRRVNPDVAFEIYTTRVDSRYPTIEDVAKKMGAHPNTIYHISSRYKWAEKRAELIRQAHDRFQEEMIEITKQEKYKEFEDWNVLEDIVMEALRGLKKMQEVDRNAKDLQEKIAAMKVLKSLPLDLFNLSNALKTVKFAKRTLLGIPTDITKGELSHVVKKTLALDELEEMAQHIKKNQIVYADADGS